MNVRKRKAILRKTMLALVANIMDTAEKIPKWFPKDCSEHFKCLQQDLEDLGFAHDDLRKLIGDHA